MRIIECKMLDLSDLSEKKVVNRFLMCQLTGVGADFSQKLEAYGTNIARLVDKAVSEYNSARSYALAEVDEHKRSTAEVQENGSCTYVLSVANELENCIITTWRLLMHFEDIKSDMHSPTIDKILRKQILLPRYDITHIRDAVVHMDDDIRKGQKQTADVITPVLNSDATEIKLLSHVLHTKTLALTIRRIHDFAYKFMEHRVNAKAA